MPTPNSGLSATLPADVLLDSGVLYMNADVAFCATDGGLSFDPAPTRENIDFDGKFYAVQGLDRMTGGAPKISGKVIEASATKLSAYEAGSASNTVGAVTTLTPRIAGELYGAGDYVSNVRVAYRRGGGGFAIVKFPIAYIASWKIGPGTNKRSAIDIEIEARQDIAAANTGVVPYVIELAAAIAGS
jgi:hypothetical protein